MAAGSSASGIPYLPGIGIVGIQTTGPFPDVAAQLLATIGAGAAEATHGAGRVEAGIAVVVTVGVGLVSPGINSAIRAARRFFPFRFRGQADAQGTLGQPLPESAFRIRAEGLPWSIVRGEFAQLLIQPAAMRYRVAPAHPHHRMVGNPLRLFGSGAWLLSWTKAANCATVTGQRDR